MTPRPFPIQNSRFFILSSLLLFTILHSPFSILRASPFADNGNGTVTDSATGLLWQKCSRGQANDATCSGTALTYTWQQALASCDGLLLASKTWRLPSVNELKTLIDRGKASGATIDTSAFPATVAGVYWTSTTYPPSGSYAWAGYFDYGYVGILKKADSYPVRCVAAGP